LRVFFGGKLLITELPLKVLRKHFFPPNNAEVQTTALFFSFIFGTVTAYIFRSSSVSHEDSKSRTVTCLKTHVYILDNGKKREEYQCKTPLRVSCLRVCQPVIALYEMLSFDLQERDAHLMENKGQTTYLELI